MYDVVINDEFFQKCQVCVLYVNVRTESTSEICDCIHGYHSVCLYPTERYPVPAVSYCSFFGGTGKQIQP